jgi:hypothetical protein
MKCSPRFYQPGLERHRHPDSQHGNDPTSHRCGRCDPRLDCARHIFTPAHSLAALRQYLGESGNQHATHHPP